MPFWLPKRPTSKTDEESRQINSEKEYYAGSKSRHLHKSGSNSQLQGRNNKHHHRQQQMNKSKNQISATSLNSNNSNNSNHQHHRRNRRGSFFGGGGIGRNNKKRAAKKPKDKSHLKSRLLRDDAVDENSDNSNNDGNENKSKMNGSNNNNKTSKSKLTADGNDEEDEDDDDASYGYVNYMDDADDGITDDDDDDDDDDDCLSEDDYYDDEESFEGDEKMKDELERAIVRLDGIEVYAIVSSLTLATSVSCFDNFDPTTIDVILEQRAVFTFVAELFYYASAAIGMMTGLHATLIFSLVTMYGRTALGIDRDDAFNDFFGNTGGERFSGFRSFRMSLYCFMTQLCFLIEQKIAFTPFRPLVLVGTGYLAYTRMYQDSESVANAAGVIYSTPQTPIPAPAPAPPQKKQPDNNNNNNEDTTASQSPPPPATGAATTTNNATSKTTEATTTTTTAAADTTNTSTNRKQRPNMMSGSSNLSTRCFGVDMSQKNLSSSTSQFNSSINSISYNNNSNNDTTSSPPASASAAAAAAPGTGTGTTTAPLSSSGTAGTGSSQIMPRRQSYKRSGSLTSNASLSKDNNSSSGKLNGGEQPQRPKRRSSIRRNSISLSNVANIQHLKEE